MKRASDGALTSRQWLGFSALCLLGASSWLVDAAWPSPLPVAGRQTLDELAMAAALAVISWKTLASLRHLQTRTWLRLAAASVLLLGIPATLAQIASIATPEVTVTILFTLAPVMVVILLANLGNGGEGAAGTSHLLGPALAGFAGTLLLLPVAAPASWRQAGFSAVAAMAVLAAAFAGIWLHGLLREFTVAQAALVCCLANALYSFAALAVNSHIAASDVPFIPATWSWKDCAFETLKALLFNLPQVLLLVWLLRDLTPSRFAARYLAIPLVTVIEGYAVLRPVFDLRALAGLALMAFGAWHLLTGNGSQEEPTLVLR